MKKSIAISVFSFVVVFVSFSQQKPFLSDIYSFIENTSVYETNQVEGHVPLIRFRQLTRPSGII